MLELEFMPYTLNLRHVFRISQGARDSTPIMLIRISYDGVNGYGEASMPPLYGESSESARAYLAKLNLSQFDDPFDLERILNYVDGLAPGNAAIKASIDL